MRHLGGSLFRQLLRRQARSAQRKIHVIRHILAYQVNLRAGYARRVDGHIFAGHPAHVLPVLIPAGLKTPRRYLAGNHMAPYTVANHFQIFQAFLLPFLHFCQGETHGGAAHFVAVEQYLRVKPYPLRDAAHQKLEKFLQLCAGAAILDAAYIAALRQVSDAQARTHLRFGCILGGHGVTLAAADGAPDIRALGTHRARTHQPHAVAEALAVFRIAHNVVHIVGGAQCCHQLTVPTEAGRVRVMLVQNNAVRFQAHRLALLGGNVVRHRAPLLVNFHAIFAAAAHLRRSVKREKRPAIGGTRRHHGAIAINDCPAFHETQGLFVIHLARHVKRERVFYACQEHCQGAGVPFRVLCHRQRHQRPGKVHHVFYRLAYLWAVFIQRTPALPDGA